MGYVSLSCVTAALGYTGRWIIGEPGGRSLGTGMGLLPGKCCPGCRVSARGVTHALDVGTGVAVGTAPCALLGPRMARPIAKKRMRKEMRDRRVTLFITLIKRRNEQPVTG